MSGSRPLCSLPVAVTVVTVQLSSHDFWLAATTWPPGADGKATITAGVGERRDVRVVATDVTLPSPGAYLAVALVSAQTIEMKGREFTERRLPSTAPAPG